MKLYRKIISIVKHQKFLLGFAGSFFYLLNHMEREIKGNNIQRKVWLEKGMSGCTVFTCIR